MALTLTQLLAAPSVDDWRTMLLAALKGIGIVIKTGAGAGGAATGTGNVTVDGTPATQYTKILVQITTSGELNSAVFKYSLDGGSTFVSGITVPASPGTYVLGATGVTLTFVSGSVGAGTSFVLGDIYTFALNTPSLPVTSWPASSGYRQLVEVEAQALAALSAQQASLAAGGFTALATGSWCDLVGTYFYGLARLGVGSLAGVTKGQVLLSNPAAAGPFTIAVGSMWFASTGGLLYSNTTGGVLPNPVATPVNTAFTAGVGTLPNATYYYRVSAINASGETLASAETSLVIAAGPQGVNVNWGAVAGATGYKIYGRTTGSELLIATVGAVTTYLDNGSITPAGALPTANTTGTLAIQVAAQSPGAAYNVPNNTITTITGGVLAGVTVNNPDPGTGTWITSQGTDAESDSAYMLRCQQSWPSLGVGSPTAAYQLWSTLAEKAAGHTTTVSKTLVQQDTAIAGQINIYLAGASGSVAGSAVTDVTTYITLRVALPATINVASATNAVMTIGGQVTYYASVTTPAAVQAAVNAALVTYIGSMAIGSDAGITVKVSYEEVIAAIGSVLGGAGVAIKDLTGITLNAGTADVGLTLGQVATLTNNLTFVGA
jgi:hypothetical protein